MRVLLQKGSLMKKYPHTNYAYEKTLFDVINIELKQEVTPLGIRHTYVNLEAAKARAYKRMDELAAEGVQVTGVELETDVSDGEITAGYAVSYIQIWQLPFAEIILEDNQYKEFLELAALQGYMMFTVPLEGEDAIVFSNSRALYDTQYFNIIECLSKKTEKSDG